MRYAVYAGTRNVYEYLIPSIKSLIANSNVDKIFLLIEDDVFPYWIPPCVEVINVREQKFFSPDGPNFSSAWSYMVLLRAAYCYILPKEVDKVLSLDMDTIAIRDVSSIWNYDISDYYFAGAKEPDKSEENLYVNMGVTLHNLKLLRESGMADKLIKELNTTKHEFPEQDVFNKLCAGKIFEIDSIFNSSICTKPTATAFIRHFAAEPINRWSRSTEYVLFKFAKWEDVLKERKRRG